MRVPCAQFTKFALERRCFLTIAKTYKFCGDVGRRFRWPDTFDDLVQDDWPNGETIGCFPQNLMLLRNVIIRTSGETDQPFFASFVANCCVLRKQQFRRP
ncbi:hypothetical protein BV898_09844 [Hypsibius exemplaris]|uniref:Uncharacterized protein n=1 Tax=Hypsibius exemplaris TaxID=2072580 RepID=A0A1W0WLJ9_HYPEX|nr:hypothetical protein BV898_09844 [Hypsibius exemplaris]